MALKGDRNYNDQVSMNYFMNAVQERGVVLVHNTSGSGASLDDADATVVAPTGGVSGSLPAGLLLNDVVNLDLTRQRLNQHQDEVQIGSKVLLLRRGVVSTNMIPTGDSPSAGNPAYYDTSGNLTVTATPDDGSPTNNQVGRFLSSKDDDGYALVEINIV